MSLLSAYSFETLAHVLRCGPKQLGYYLHKRPLASQYKTFKIPKKRDGFRTISAPSTNLKLIQRSLARELEELRTFKPCVNGFVAKRDIRRNASFHIGQRFVLNIDLEDFFGSINFGRVYGMLSKAPYSVAAPVAAAIAKACTLHDKLPQGAPTSPIISNLICAKMDAELTRFAAANRCRYTRYADDLTFSTTRPFMPLASIVPSPDGNFLCEINASLRTIIENSGFRINENKVRLRDQTARQEVTGLIVNKRVNVKRRLVREVRAMLHAWRKFGLSAASTAHQKDHGGTFDFESVLRGKIEFIGQIRGRPDELFRRLASQFNSLASSGQIRTKPTFDEVARHATWIIESDSDGQGTAFFLQGYGLVTCAHCVGPNPYIWHPYFPSKKHNVKLVAQDKHRDLAVLQAPADLAPQPLNLYSGPPLRDGADIALFGYPNHGPGRTVRVEGGKLLRTFPSSGVSHLEITPKIISGNSGGPVLNSKYEVTGVAVRGVSGSTTLSTAEFFAINATELRIWLPTGPDPSPAIS
jgi:retron-type reverse transcriptase/S1-C subfamily serine protease